jgi:Phosphotransferase enzyme family
MATTADRAIACLESVYAGSAVDPSTPLARETVARAIDFSLYCKWARVYDVCHDFWSPLLPESTIGGRAVVFETRLGVLSELLSRRFDFVVSVHASDAAAQHTLDWLLHRSISNVAVHVLGADWNHGEQPLDAVILIDASQDPTEQWHDRLNELSVHARRIAEQRLSRTGSFVQGGENSWGYARLLGRKARFGESLPALLRNDASFPVKHVYVGTSPLSATHAPPPECASLHVAGQHASRPTGWPARLKSAVVHSTAMRYLWPTYLLFSMRSNAPSEILARLEHEGILNFAHDSESAAWVVKRVVAGNHGVTIAIVGHRQKEADDIVVRWCLHSAGQRLLHVNADALERLAITEWTSLIPRLILHKKVGNLSFSAESLCRGFELEGNSPESMRHLKNACVRLVDLQFQSASILNMDESRYARMILPWFDDLRLHCGEEYEDSVVKLEVRLGKLMRGRSFSIGPCHGDLKLGNVLFGVDGTLSGVIDWDCYTDEGLPIHDYLTMFTYKLGLDYGLGLDEVFLRFILPWQLPTSYLECAQPAVERFCGNDEGFLLARACFWFSLLQSRFSMTFKLHETWRTRYVKSVIKPIHAALDHLALPHAVEPDLQ